MILDSLWRDDEMLTFVDSTNRIVNISLNPSRKPIQVLNGHEVVDVSISHLQGDINCVAWTRDGRALISGGEDRVIKVGTLFGMSW